MTEIAHRFVIVGALSALGYLVLTFLLQHWLNLPVWISSGLAYIVAFSVTYFVQHAWTFAARAAHDRALPRYIATQLVSMFVTMAIMRIFPVLFVDPPKLLASIVATIVAGSASFILSSKWAFSDDKEDRK